MKPKFHKFEFFSIRVFFLFYNHVQTLGTQASDSGGAASIGDAGDPVARALVNLEGFICLGFIETILAPQLIRRLWQMHVCGSLMWPRHKMTFRLVLDNRSQYWNFDKTKGEVIKTRKTREESAGCTREDKEKFPRAPHPSRNILEVDEDSILISFVCAREVVDASPPGNLEHRESQCGSLFLSLVSVADCAVRTNNTKTKPVAERSERVRTCI